jgi:hypothetical protein
LGFVVSCGEFQVFWGSCLGFAPGILGGGDWELCFFLHKIGGEFVVIRWFLCAFCWWETTGFFG